MASYSPSGFVAHTSTGLSIMTLFSSTGLEKKPVQDHSIFFTHNSHQNTKIHGATKTIILPNDKMAGHFRVLPYNCVKQ